MVTRNRMKALLQVLLLALMCGCSTSQQRESVADSAAVEAVVRGYIMAYQDQRWEDVVACMHPETIKNLRDAVLSGFPKRDSDVTDAQRPEVDDLLKVYGVATIREAWKLPPRELVLRMLRRNGQSPTMQAMTRADTTVKGVSVQWTAEGIVADASVVSRLGEREFSGTTHFLLERVKGHYLVVSMAKTREHEEQ
jgi:hypothetical protein